jgi:hypothetical protein
MKVASTSETSAKLYQIKQQNNQEERHLHIRRRENLKFHSCLLGSKGMTMSCKQETSKTFSRWSFHIVLNPVSCYLC